MVKNQKGGNYNLNLLQGLIDLYNDFLQRIDYVPVNNYLNCYLSETTPNILECDELLISYDDESDNFVDLNNLQIETSLKEMKKYYQLCGIIQLRPYRGQNVLILGCGNYRLNDGGGYSFLNTDTNKQEHYQFHHHYDEYTVDIDLAANPSTLADLSQQSLCNVPDKSFQFIIVEGGGPDANDFLAQEVNRLLKNQNSFYINMTNNGVFVIQFYKNDGIFYTYNI